MYACLGMQRGQIILVYVAIMVGMVNLKRSIGNKTKRKH